MRVLFCMLCKQDINYRYYFIYKKVLSILSTFYVCLFYYVFYLLSYLYVISYLYFIFFYMHYFASFIFNFFFFFSLIFLIINHAPCFFTLNASSTILNFLLPRIIFTHWTFTNEQRETRKWIMIDFQFQISLYNL